MLCCITCGAFVAVALPLGLSVTAVETVCSAYRTSLAQAHKDHCTFRLQAEQYLRKQTISSALPTAFASVFPHDVVELLEHPSPVGLLRQRVAAIQAMASQNQSGSPFLFPNLEITGELQSFESCQEDQTASILDYVATSEFLGTNNIQMVALAVLGWAPDITRMEESEGTRHMVASLSCSLCFADMELTLHKAGNEEDSSYSHKRRKKLARYCNPHDAHRYYCPFVSGFCSTVTTYGTPFWKVLLEKLGETSQSRIVDNDSSTENTTRIRTILKSGIRPHKVEL
jgi:hypothetical protein